MTEESTVLDSAGKGRTHSKVNHSIKEYARKEGEICVTTNSVEGYFSLLKRGISGVCHHWSKKHLHRYLSEFDFRYNAQNISDVERRNEAIKQSERKRLMYRDSCPKA